MAAGACLDRGGGGGARAITSRQKKKKKKNAALAPARTLRDVPRFDSVHARTYHVHVTVHIMSVCLYDCSVWAHRSEVGQKSCQYSLTQVTVSPSSTGVTFTYTSTVHARSFCKIAASPVALSQSSCRFSDFLLLPVTSIVAFSTDINWNKHATALPTI